MSDQRSIAELYLVAVESFVDFARTLDTADWATQVPCTPSWTARDVLSHVSGIPDDAVAGRMDGAPGEAWTAAQVDRNRDASVEALLSRWSQQAPAFAEVIDQMGEGRPRSTATVTSTTSAMRCPDPVLDRMRSSTLHRLPRSMRRFGSSSSSPTDRT